MKAHFVGKCRRELYYLQVLAKSKPKIRKVIIKHGPGDVLLSMFECCYNVLKGTIPLTKAQKQTLLRYKKHLRALANKKVSRVNKKRLVTQRGGNLLSALFPPVLSVLKSLFKNVFGFVLLELVL